MAVARTLGAVLVRSAKRSPIVVVSGPRQSGKTTLVRQTFPDKPYVNLEAPDVRARAIEDPRGFLDGYRRGAVLDEVQRAPDLLSYLQVDVDAKRQRGRWILSGSQNLLLAAGVSQSLAGRATLLDLYPLGLDELKRGKWLAADLFNVLIRGGYPAPFDRRQPAQDWHADYVRTYVERDVRSVLGVGDLLAFQTFLGLVAGRTGQVLNLSQLGSDSGISHNTAKSWIGVLEASFLVIRLPAFSRNVGKRLTKAPKLHLLDSGLACYLLGIRTAAELRVHPLRGAIFESWVVAEVLKTHRNAGVTPRLSYYRDAHGLEVDLLVERGNEILGLETKSGATIGTDAFGGLEKVGETIPELRERVVVHGGDDSWTSRGARAVSYRDLDQAVRFGSPVRRSAR